MSHRVLLQGLIDGAVLTGQRHLHIPPGEYVVDRAPNAWWCLQIPPAAVGLRLHGAGIGSTVIRMADGSPTSTRVIAARGSDCSLDSLTLEGGRQGDLNEHRAGLMIMGPRFRASEMLASGFTGDGIYVYIGADWTRVDRCVCSGNLRNGITLGAHVSNVRVTDSEFVSNSVQQFDTEPGVGSMVRNVLVQDCILDARGASGDYVMTLGGTSAATPGSDIVVSRCLLNGPTRIVWGDRVRVVDCSGTNGTGKPSLSVYRTARDVDVSRCSFRSESSAVGLSITGTGSGSCPERVRISDTDVTIGTGGVGVSMSSVMEVELSNVRVSRTGSVPAPSSMGIAFRATNPDQSARLIRIDSCEIEGFQGRSIAVGGNFWVGPSGSRAYARLERLEVSRTVASSAVQLDDGAGTVETLVLGPGNVLPSIVGLTSGTRVVHAD